VGIKGATPVPVSGMESGTGLWLVVMLSVVAGAGPRARGEKVTAIVHEERAVS